jgi:mannose-6-phosphate isomerase-like protein (cupin superfamily)
MPPGEGCGCINILIRIRRYSFSQEGIATYTVGTTTGTTTLEARAGQIIIAPADMPHTFVNSGDGKFRQVDIHLSTRFTTEWLED